MAKPPDASAGDGGESMIAALVNTLRWSGSLGRKFIGVVPGPTLAIVGATLVSQISMLLAFILPVKIVILLGSDGIPGYFPSSFEAVDRDMLIVLLSTGTAGFYLLYLSAERLIAFLTRIGTKALLATSGKMALFEGQDDMAANAYARFSRAVAGAVFIALAFAAITLLYTGMAGVVAGYAVFAALATGGLYKTSGSFRERLQTRLGPTLNLFTGIGFFIAFGYLVADFLAGTPPGIIAALISLILMRQAVGRIAGVVTGLSGLQRQRTKLDALFFHGRPFMPPQSSVERSMWPLLRKQRRDEWVRPLLEEVTSAVPDSLRYQWLDLGTPNVAALAVRDGEARSCRYLVKLFETNRSAAALHEATLLADPLAHLPAPELLGATEVDRFHSHVYSWCDGAPSTAEEFNEHAAEQVRVALLRVEPPASLVERYQRSRAMLWQRLTPSMLEWMQVAAETADHEAALERMSTRLADVQALLRELPPALVNPDITRDTLWVPEDGERSPLLISWDKWALEPVGAGWPVRSEFLEHLGPAVARAAETRSALAAVRAEHAEIAALAYQFESLAGRQRYAYALELLPDILQRLDASEPMEASGNVARV